jgi:hypothetical protein
MGNDDYPYTPSLDEVTVLSAEDAVKVSNARVEWHTGRAAELQKATDAISGNSFKDEISFPQSIDFFSGRIELSEPVEGHTDKGNIIPRQLVLNEVPIGHATYEPVSHYIDMEKAQAKKWHEYNAVFEQQLAMTPSNTSQPSLLSTKEWKSRQNYEGYQRGAVVGAFAGSVVYCLIGLMMAHDLGRRARSGKWVTEEIVIPPLPPIKAR